MFTEAIKMNKKAYVGDVAYGTLILFGFFIIAGFSIYIYSSFNTQVQSMDVMPSEAKLESSTWNNTFPSYLGYLFIAGFAGLFIYSIVTAYLIDVVSKVWFVVGFFLMIFQALFFGIIKYIFTEISSQDVFSSALTNIPYASIYFNNLILFNAVWGSLILLTLYFKSEV